MTESDGRSPIELEVEARGARRRRTNEYRLLGMGAGVLVAGAMAVVGSVDPAFGSVAALGWVGLPVAAIVGWIFGPAIAGAPWLKLPCVIVGTGLAATLVGWAVGVGAGVAFGLLFTVLAGTGSMIDILVVIATLTIVGIVPATIITGAAVAVWAVLLRAAVAFRRSRTAAG